MARTIFDLLPGEGLLVGLTKQLSKDPSLSGRSILRSLRLRGLGIRTATFYQLLSYFRNEQTTGASYVADLGLSEQPIAERLARSLTNTLRNYTYQIEVFGRDEETGQPSIRNLTISTNRLLSKQQAIQAAGKMWVLDPNENYQGQTFEGATVVSILRNSGGQP